MYKNNHRRNLVVLSVLGLISLSACVTEKEQPTTTGSGAGILQGNLHLYNKQGNESCSMPLLNGIHAFENSSGYGCPNDNIYSWSVDSAKPGAGISFYDNGYCGRYDTETNYSWRIVGTPYTGVTVPATSKLSVQHNGTTDTVVYPGVNTDGSGHQGQMVGKVSCISIDHAE